MLAELRRHSIQMSKKLTKKTVVAVEAAEILVPITPGFVSKMNPHTQSNSILLSGFPFIVHGNTDNNLE
jgi:hypothetical protein